ncbi:MAG: DUF4332 domain-containing protein [Anaerolineae bacterium]|nr:MAG: DUF4332 domain-containing protein [Anaerolineae bacterium]
MKLAYVEGIGPVYAAKLEAVGVKNTEQLLQRGSTPQGRRELAEQSGISPDLLLKWINHVDMFRVKGIGSEYAELLEQAGVDTVPELAQRNPDNLYETLVAVNAEKSLVRRLPSRGQVADWVKQAKSLPRVINY